MQVRAAADDAGPPADDPAPQMTPPGKLGHLIMSALSATGFASPGV
tara:strand:- start:421 stop:558 length:138 start_codon:yes stop_codon:yes gene_type:complete